MDSNTLQPLRTGDIVSAGLRLYRSNLSRYLPVAVVAACWPLLGLLGWGLAVGVGVAVGTVSGTGLGILVGLVLSLGALGLMLFSMAKSGLNSAVIARLAFQELINQPESIAAARHTLRPRLWKFVWVQGLLAGCLLVTQIAIGFVQNFVGFPLMIVVGDSALTVFLLAALNLGGLALYYWVFARLFVPDLAIALEAEDLTASQAIERSWSLSKGSATRISLVLLLASLVTVPFFAIALVPLVLAFLTALPTLETWVTGTPDVAFLEGLGLAVLASIGLFLVANLLLLSFWQAIKAVLYYDLCSRQEGLDLKLSRGDRSSSPRMSSGTSSSGTSSSGISSSGISSSAATAPRSASTGSKTGQTRRTSTGSTGDEQWAAAIAAMNAGNQQATPAANSGDPKRPIPFNPKTKRPTPPPTDLPPLSGTPNPTPRISAQAQPIAASLSSHGGLYYMGGRDFEDLEAYLLGRSSLSPNQRKEQSLALARRLKETIQLAQLPSKLTPELFLEALYLAYRDRT